MMKTIGRRCSAEWGSRADSAGDEISEDKTDP
jgi:hypothetical protein